MMNPLFVSRRRSFTTLSSRWLPPVAALLLLAGWSGGLRAQTLYFPNVEVSGAWNPWLGATGATDPYDSQSENGPITLDLSIADSGTVLTFSVTGSVNNSGGTPTDPPDGGPGNFVQHAPENGFSGVIAPVDALVGIFVQDPVADPTNANAPAGLDFSNTSAGAVANGIDYTTLAPVLNQVFFIGDGVTSGGITQQITVPNGATGLVLGSMDSYGWYDNTGGFIVNVYQQAAGASNTTLTTTTFDVDGYPDNKSSTLPVIAPGDPITFTATQGGFAAPGLFVRVQAAPVPADGNILEIPESTWTDLTDTTNGGNGFLAGDGKGNYALTTTQYPTGEVVAFRAISAASNQKDEISSPIGPFDFTTTTPPPTGTGLSIAESVSTADDPTGSVAIVGDEITYKYTVVNSGTATLTNAKVTIVLPATLQFQSADNGYTLTGGNVVTYTFPLLSPTTGTPLTLTLVATVTSNAVIGKTIINNGYSVSSDTTGIVQGAVPSGTTIIPPLEVVVTGGKEGVIPGQTITYHLRVTNRTPGVVKGISIVVPLPGPTHLNDSGTGFVDANGATVAAPTAPGGAANPLPTSTNLTFYFDKIKPGKSAYAQFTVIVPLDVDPASTITQGGAQVATKTEVDGVNTFTLPDIVTPLSGQSAPYLPRIVVAKLVADDTALTQFFGIQHSLEKKLLKAVESSALDPAVAAQVAKTYPDLLKLTPATATTADLAAALNGDINVETSDTTGQPVETIPLSSATDPSYITFLLPYANNGAATVADAVIQDQVPAGTSIYLPKNGGYNESVVINKKLGSLTSGNLEIIGGTTLRFHVGDIGPGDVGFVLYQVRVLAPGEAGAPSVDSVLTTSGSSLSAPALSNTYQGQPDGQDLTVIGRYAYYFDSYTVQNVTTGDSPVVQYDIPYQNTGRKSTVFEIDDPIPAGLQYVTSQLLDANHQPLSAQAAAEVQPGAVVVPADTTNGTLVFHPPLFNKKGKLAAGDGGYISVYFAPLGTTTAFIHSPSIPPSSYGKTSAHHGGPAHTRRASRPTARDAASTGAVTATSRTLVDDGARGKVFVALVLPMIMVEGQPNDVFVVEGSLNDQRINDTVAGDPIVTLPAGFAFGQTLLGTDIAKATPTQNADGTTSVDVDFVAELPGHSASVARFTVIPQMGTASSTPVVFPGCGVSFAFNEALGLQTGPVNVQVMTPSQVNALPALQAQVASGLLRDVDTSSKLFIGFVNNIGRASHTAVLAGASAASVSNGAFVIPLQNNNTLAMGPANTVMAVSSQARTAATAQGDYVFATGADTDVMVGQAAGRGGATMPQQSAGAMFTGLAANASGNGLKIGAVNVQNGGGHTIISQDGGSVISNDGGSLTTPILGVISNDGGSFAAGLANTVGLVSDKGNGVIGENSSGLISEKGNGVISNDGGSFISTSAGLVMHANGANGVIGENSSGVIGENSSGLVGTPDESVSVDATAAGCINQVGSAAGAIGENSSGIVAAGGGN